MKNNIYYMIMVFIISLSSCKAQIVNIDNDNYSRIPGVYYKDTNNQLDRYVGTWLYTNGMTSLKIIIQKKYNNFNPSKNFYEDILIGEYQYIENGVEIVNTLPRLQDSSINSRNHFISGNYLLKHFYRPICNDCDEIFKRVRIHFKDPERDYMMTDAYIGYQENLPNDKMIFDLQMGTSLIPNDTSPQTTRVPAGHYILVKQN
ncbi:DUF6705 family protein [Flavobacterium enshiense]|uniref:DUF6705 family protein n=1 Tax=Flavobacterium enshiense TaxID=1341165 RepID=UPI00345CE8E3